MEHAHVVHSIENSPMHGLQAISGVGKRPSHNHGHRVREITILELILDFPRKNSLGSKLFVCSISGLCHAENLALNEHADLYKVYYSKSYNTAYKV